MVRIAITQAAFDAIVATMQLGLVAVEPELDAKGERLISLDLTVLNRLRALRWPSESYSDVILRLSAYNAEERSVIEVVQRGRDKPLTKEEIHLSLEQARDLGQIDDSTGARLPLQAPLRPLRRFGHPPAAGPAFAGSEPAVVADCGGSYRSGDAGRCWGNCAASQPRVLCRPFHSVHLSGEERAADRARENASWDSSRHEAFLLGECRPIISEPLPTIDLTDDELAAVTEAIRRTIEDDRFPHAPRLDPLRAALGKFDAASEPTPQRRPHQPKPRSGCGDNRRCSMGDTGILPISDEQAKLGQELVKSASGLGGWFADVLGDSPRDLVGLLIGDEIKAKRSERIVLLWHKTRERLRDRAVEPEPPSLKYAIPILEAAADEENEELQDLWSRLLAAAMDPNRRDTMRQSFVATVKRMDPIDAIALKAIRGTGPNAYTTVHELERQLQCSMDEAMVSIDHLAELGCVALNYQNPALKPFGTLLMNVVSG